jgi:hypothetical protein
MTFTKMSVQQLVLTVTILLFTSKLLIHIENIFYNGGTYYYQFSPRKTDWWWEIEDFFSKCWWLPPKKGFVATYINVSLIFYWKAKICVSHKLWIIYEFGSILASTLVHLRISVIGYWCLTPLSTIFQLHHIVAINFIDGEHHCPTATQQHTWFE